MRKYFLLLSFLLSCYLLLLGCQANRGCDPPDDRLLDEEVLNAIPHTDGQRITYDVSDGSSFVVTFQGGLRPAEEDTGCTEQFIMDFSGGNGIHSLNGVIDAYPREPGFANIHYIFNFNMANRNTMIVELFGAGDITAGRNATARVLAEITRNGRTYQNVLEQNFNSTFNDQIERAYYNLDFGLLGVDMFGGITIWQR